MKQLLAVLGILALAGSLGHARDGRETRVAAKTRTGSPERGIRTGQVYARRRDDGLTVSAPIAIDSETGELYCVQQGSTAAQIKRG